MVRARRQHGPRVLGAREQRPDVGLPDVALVRVALEDHLLDLVRVDPEQAADEPDRDHVLAATAAARLLRQAAERHLGGARLELGRDLHRLGVADDVPVGRQLVMVEVERLLVEAHQQVDRVALRVHLVDAHAHLVHAGAALDLGRIGPEGDAPSSPCARRRW